MKVAPAPVMSTACAGAAPMTALPMTAARPAAMKRVLIEVDTRDSSKRVGGPEAALNRTLRFLDPRGCRMMSYLLQRYYVAVSPDTMQREHRLWINGVRRVVHVLQYDDQRYSINRC